MASFWAVSLSIYFLLNFLLSLYVYFDIKKFYTKKNIITEGETPELIDVHEKFKVFRRNDKFSFLRILLGLNLLFWPKLIMSCFIILFLILLLG